MTEHGATTSRYGDPMAGYRTLGRLLWAGLVAGAVIGATVGTLVVGSVAYLPLGLLAGATAGMVAGVVSQAVTFVLLLAVRKAMPTLSVCAAYVVLGALRAPLSGRQDTPQH